MPGCPCTSAPRRKGVCAWAGASPTLPKAFHRWLPLHERTRAQGVMWMSARLGGAFTPGLVFLCLQYVTWRTAFLLFGGLGVIWAVLFFWWYRDDPRASKHVNAAEAALDRKGVL